MVNTPHPAGEVVAEIAVLEAAGRAGDRESVLSILRTIVPGYVRELPAAAASRG